MDLSPNLVDEVALNLTYILSTSLAFKIKVCSASTPLSIQNMLFLCGLNRKPIHDLNSYKKAHYLCLFL